MTERRRCKGKNQAGDPCGAYPLRPGTLIEDVSVTGDWCIIHDPDLPEGAKPGGPQPGAGRPRNPRGIDILRERFEAEADRVLNPLFDALEADIATVVGRGEEAMVDYQPDHRTRLLAIKEILDRVYGRPKQATEITGPQGGPVQVIDPGNAEARDAIAELLRHRPATPSEG
jgi:hypothetical protein